MSRGHFFLVFLILAICLLSGSACARQRSTSADNTPGNFDYYLLTLSWAPEFCATHQDSAASSECDPTRHYGFVVHGLWPENADGSFPERCAPARPVSQAIVQHMLPIMPSRGLIQHEWATHGICIGVSPQDYFAEVEKAFGQLQIPPQYRALSRPVTVSPSTIEQAFAEVNHAPRNAFRVSCSRTEFVGLEVCLTKDLQFRQCGSGVRECRAPQITMRQTP
jgi:ribonuclease T2